MKKTREIIYIITIVLAAVSVASANTFFTESESKILENWNKNKVAAAVGEPEGYSEPESMKNPEYTAGNTLFNQDEWKTLENWNREKSDKKMGEPEGYSEPGSKKMRDVTVLNTFFTKDEMEILEKF